MNVRATALPAALVLLATTPALAHHEAVFGPQSSLVLSAPGFASTQVYTKNLGTSAHSTQETTFVLSAGIRPWRAVPLSFALTLPASIAAEGGSTTKGLENAVLGVRYRLDFDDLQRRWGKDGNFVMAIGAVEPPTGTMDHRAFDGPFNYIAGALTSLERGEFGATMLALYRREGADSSGGKNGDTLLFGAGVAYTPLDHPGKMLSFQLGMTEENHRTNIAAGQTVSDSGGSELILTPAIVGSPHRHLQLFGLFSVPLWQNMRDPAERSRWRAGFGIVYLFEAETEPAPRTDSGR